MHTKKFLNLRVYGAPRLLGFGLRPFFARPLSLVIVALPAIRPKREEAFQEE